MKTSWRQPCKPEDFMELQGPAASGIAAWAAPRQGSSWPCHGIEEGASQGGRQRGDVPAHAIDAAPQHTRLGAPLVGAAVRLLQLVLQDGQHLGCLRAAAVGKVSRSHGMHEAGA